ncbi:nitronate monooxygenase [Candidatus Daviesbacteria bacterium]|nr:nitronate monooxygenase [Candidatus Daviesbacteria bacterium]
MNSNPELKAVVIQGGMGVGVSRYPLTRAVSLAGEKLGVPIMGTLSGTGIGPVVARILQNGDPGGHYQRAFEAFPNQKMAEHVWNTYYIEGGKAADKSYKPTPMVNFVLGQNVAELIICANFAEVWLGKQDHNRPIAINYLEKIQTPHLPELYGAMLAGVDVVIMGAGIPDQVPGVLDKFSRGQPASYLIDVDGKRLPENAMIFNPSVYTHVTQLKRPDFYAIVASNVLAKVLKVRQKNIGGVNGFIVENSKAGGHNAPPREKNQFNKRGEPVYGPKDEVNLKELANLNVPFWLAGAYADPQKIAEAIVAGASGIQAGSIFALCEESGLRDDLKRSIIKLAFEGKLDVISDPRCSPSGFPFNVVQLSDTISDPKVYGARLRICDIGYLRQAYRENDEGGVRFHCPAEPVKTYTKRGGRIEDTEGRVCLCNNLFAAAGLGQIRNGELEPAIVTLGHDWGFIRYLITNGNGRYTAENAITYLFGNQALKAAV